MKVTILGSGTSVPHAARSSSGFWVETAETSVLLDCSAAAVHRAAQEKLDWANLDSIWISHFHLDHVGGIAPFLFGTKYAPETQGRTKKLSIFGPQGVKRLLEKFDAANDYHLLTQPFPLEIIEVEELEPFDIAPNLRAVAASTMHTGESLAVHLRDAAGATLVYSSDTGYEQSFAGFAREADLLILECSFVNEKPVETHLNLAEAMRLISRAEPKKAVLTHFYPEWDAVDFEREIAKFSPRCEVLEAKDGLRLEF